MIDKFSIIGADIADYLSSVGFSFYRSDKVGFPNQPLTDKDLKLFKALAQMYPYLQKHLPTDGLSDIGLRSR